MLNSRNAGNEGTRITAIAPPCASPFKCIAAKKKLTIIDIVASRMLMTHGYLKAVFDVFDRFECAIDMVSTSEVSISLTVESNDRLPAICAELGKIADVKLEGNKALICMVGEDIRGQHGIAGRVFSAIRHINVRMISQGASEINMSFMIEESDVEDAVRSLHAEFFAQPDPAIFDTEAEQSPSRPERLLGTPPPMGLVQAPRTTVPSRHDHPGPSLDAGCLVVCHGVVRCDVGGRRDVLVVMPVGGGGVGAVAGDLHPQRIVHARQPFPR